jgi:hypothetical protein
LLIEGATVVAAIDGQDGVGADTRAAALVGAETSAGTSSTPTT